MHVRGSARSCPANEATGHRYLLKVARRRVRKKLHLLSAQAGRRASAGKSNDAAKLFGYLRCPSRHVCQRFHVFQRR